VGAVRVEEAMVVLSCLVVIVHQHFDLVIMFPETGAILLAVTVFEAGRNLVCLC